MKESHRIFIAALALALPAAWLSVGWAQTTAPAGEPAPQQAADASSANTADLDAIAQRVLTAQTLDEALGTR